MNPNAKITDEQFEAYLKQVRELVEGPFDEMQKEIEVTNTFPEESTSSPRKTISIVSTFPPSTADGTSTSLRSCVSRKSSLVVLAECACISIMPLT